MSRLQRPGSKQMLSLPFGFVWKVHKKNCSFFIIKEDSDRGKGFFASRDISAGTIILDDKAILTTSWTSPICLPFPSCMTCGLLMTLESTNRCSKCTWPVCSKYCEQLPVHAVNECQIFVDQSIQYPPSYSFTPDSDLKTLIYLIRAIGLKWKNPEQFAVILDLQSEFSIAEKNEYKWGPEIELFRGFLNTNDFDADDTVLQKLLKIFRINSYSTSLNDPDRLRSRSLGGLYVKSSRMNHSCVPNCTWSVSEKPNFIMRIRTTVPIKKGEPLTINYYMYDNMLGTKQRLQRIRKAGFNCKCPRCMDPTEMGTFTYPIDMKDSAVWKCNRCGKTKLSSAILPPLEKIGEMILKKNGKFGENPKDNSLLSFCKNIVSKYSGKSLHPNHWVIQDATRAAFRYLTTYRGNQMDLQTSQYYIKCGLYLLAIEDKVSPGISFNRAILQKQVGYELHNQAEELCSKRKYQKAVEKLEQCIELQTEALKYFPMFPGDDGSLGKADVLEHNTALAVEEKNSLVLQILQSLNVRA